MIIENIERVFAVDSYHYPMMLPHTCNMFLWIKMNMTKQINNSHEVRVNGTHPLKRDLFYLPAAADCQMNGHRTHT